MEQCRIPVYENRSSEGVRTWFNAMSAQELLFHPDDEPSEIFRISTGERTFSNQECQMLKAILDEMFSQHGDAVYDIAFPIFADRMGISLSADD